MIGLQDAIKVLNKKGYKLFEDDGKPFNINFIGIRDIGGQWNDQFIVMWKYEGIWSFYTFHGTTDPGAYYLDKPINTKGTAIMVEGQHRGLYSLGKHQGRYEALKPAKKVGVWRIPKGMDYADIKDITDLTLDVGWHGTNFHRAHTQVEVAKVKKYSAGCQVVQNYQEYLIAMQIIKQGFKNWGKTLTYTLLNINDFS